MKLEHKSSHIISSQEKEVINTFCDILIEERGISDEVQKETNELVNSLNDYFNKTLVNKIDYTKTDAYQIVDEFTATLFNEEINLFIYWVFFKDKKSYKENKYRFNDKYYYYHNTRNLTITINVIGNKIVSNTFSTKLVHEIKHNFQYNKFNTSFLHKKQYYKKRNLMPQNEADKNFKTIIYLSSQREQEAYASELYSELCSMAPAEYYEILPECNSYLAYKNMCKSIEFFEQNKNSNEVIAVLNRYNYKFDNFIKKSKKNCESFLHRIGRVVSLYNERKMDVNPEIIY